MSSMGCISIIHPSGNESCASVWPCRDPVELGRSMYLHRRREQREETVLTGSWHTGVWWVGPIAGGVAAGTTYEYLFMQRTHARYASSPFAPASMHRVLNVWLDPREFHPLRGTTTRRRRSDSIKEQARHNQAHTFFGHLYRGGSAAIPFWCMKTDLTWTNVVWLILCC